MLLIVLMHYLWVLRECLCGLWNSRDVQKDMIMDLEKVCDCDFGYVTPRLILISASLHIFYNY